MNSFIEKLDGWCAAATQRISAIGLIGIICVALINVGDIVTRSTFNWSIIGLDEVSTFILAASIVACVPAGLANRVNISLDVFSSRLKSPYAEWLQAFGAAVMFIFFSVLSWRMATLAQQVGGSGQTSMILQIPFAPLLWTLAILIMIAQAVQFVVVLVMCGKALKQSSAMGWVVLVFGIVLISLLASMFFRFLPIGDIGIGLPSNPAFLAAFYFAVMWIVIFLGVPLGASMGLAGVLGTAAVLGMDPALSVFGSDTFRYLSSNSLSVLPLFLLMGALASIAGLSSEIYRLASAVIGHVKGGLAHATIIGSAGFGALTGSSLATAVTIGRVALPEMKERGYSPNLATGSVAAGGTLGQLVPPSTAIIVFALVSEESIGRLFVAAIVPAFITVLFYMVAVSVYVRLVPGAAQVGKREKLPEVGRLLLRSWGVIVLFGAVMGGIYTGLFTESEAASVGVVGALIFAVARGKFKREQFWQVVTEATSTIAMIYVLIVGAVMFSFFIGVTRLPDMFIDTVSQMNMAPILVIVLMVLVYLVLGTVMDSFAIMIVTVPIFTPLALTLGYDPIWWGIVTVVCIEVGMITPPFGLNLFVLKAVSPDVRVSTIYRGVMPFVGADLIKLALLVMFPTIALWLPQTMR